jgi:hypothetical protein
MIKEKSEESWLGVALLAFTSLKNLYGNSDLGE